MRKYLNLMSWKTKLKCIGVVLLAMVSSVLASIWPVRLGAIYTSISNNEIGSVQQCLATVMVFGMIYLSAECITILRRVMLDCIIATHESEVRENTIEKLLKMPISYYGGDINERISVYSPKGTLSEMGTSFAAPWISRKLCYLIDIMGLPKEVAKALIIDSAAGWEYKQNTYKHQDLIGYGVVPINIKDILTSDNSEIKFILYETSKAYKTANYAIPVPKDKEGKYPYIARATLCYFPKCRREQGVDYTNRELSLKFGKVGKDGDIEDINKNVQDDNVGHPTERKSRQEFRKWENTKFISSLFHKNRALKSFDDKFWGFCVTSKERFTSPKKESLNFGAVITLREIKVL